MVKISIKSIYDYALQISKERHEQKKNYKTHLQLSDNYELVGVLGEMVFSLVIQEKMDTELKEGGDDGFDFNMVNIKSSEEHKAKHLIEFKDKEFNGFYVFVVVNLDKKYGYIRGYIHSKEFKLISEVINFGYGDRLSIKLDQLHPFTAKNPLTLNNIYEM